MGRSHWALSLGRRENASSLCERCMLYYRLGAWRWDRYLDSRDGGNKVFVGMRVEYKSVGISCQRRLHEAYLDIYYVRYAMRKIGRHYCRMGEVPTIHQLEHGLIQPKHSLNLIYPLEQRYLRPMLPLTKAHERSLFALDSPYSTIAAEVNKRYFTWGIKREVV